MYIESVYMRLLKHEIITYMRTIGYQSLRYLCNKRNFGWQQPDAAMSLWSEYFLCDL